MATGKILRFDEIRGYGFIAPDAGGEDVFLHANALLAEKHQYHPGVPVEFDVIEGERGLKATAVRVIKGRPVVPPVSTAPAKPAGPVPSPAVQAPSTHGPTAQPHPTPSPAAQPHTSVANGSVATAAPPVPTPASVPSPATLAAASQGAAVPTPGSATIAPQRTAASAAPVANGAVRPAAREVLTADTLNAELAEVCLESVPSMTGEQITQLRRAVVTLARRHGWVE